MVKKIVGRYIRDIERTMQEIIAAKLNDEPDFGIMLRYAMGWVDEHDQPYDKVTGKRLRPTLLLICNEAAGGDWKKALPAAAAVEILHNFSLIHDDIQDNSDLRHNRATVWKVWGRANAINAGDALYTLAYAALSDLELRPELILRVWQVFNQTNLELTRGQHLDMRFETQDSVSVEEYLSMIRGKSAALLSACASMGALIATGDEQKAQYYADFGLNIGIAFQVRDDILGIWGDPSVTGKSAATDIVSRKKSLPILYGLAESDKLGAIYAEAAMGAEQVEEAVQILDSISAREYTREYELSYYQKALSALELAEPQGKAADLLKEFVDFLFGRTR